MIYGVTLRKIWPFFYGCLGALVGGVVGGIFGIEQVARTGTGVMSYIGLGYGTNLAVGIIASLIAMSTAFALTIVLYVDRKNEVKEAKKFSQKSLKF
ncbi:beta-glucoside PTS system IIABC component [Spiroplasma clarkii]|uniref:hypothetical protein n=1 Tax=Spiroplasma clarkii TaxID=2139 RepID=UPI000B558A29|nr:hypothetical protein [Spiroplasma clarkii]ARU91507.1 beta-glucoside PTS system IIABC component [Spiroplasma clarkii]